MSDELAIEGLQAWVRAIMQGMLEKDAEIARLSAELAKCREALRPFINATLTLDGKVIGLMREDFERASNAIDAAAERTEHNPS